MIVYPGKDNHMIVYPGKDNHMIVYPGKFQAIIFNERKENQANQIIGINQEEIKAASKVKSLGETKWSQTKFQSPYQ